MLLIRLVDAKIQNSGLSAIGNSLKVVREKPMSVQPGFSC
jgi:hypothetical protein